MKKYRKIFIITIVLLSIYCLITSGAYASSYKDVNDDKYYSAAIENLTTYGIVSGYNGEFKPEANLTRAEFSKIVSLISGLEDQVENNKSYKRFDDVDLEHWGTGFINTVAENKLLIGYTDGTFRPEKNVTYAEAVTVVLRALNYSSVELGDNWPQAYIEKADSLELTKDIDFEQNDGISRGDLCLIVDRALETELYNSTAKLISKLDVKVTDELLIIATKAEDASLSIDEIKTDIGIYKLADNTAEIQPLSKAKLILNKENEIIGAQSVYIPEKSVTTVDRIVGGEIYFENGSNAKKMGISDNTYVYSDGIISNYAAQKALIEEGSAIAFLYDKAGNVEYVVVKDVEYTDAVAIKSDIYVTLSSVGVTKDEAERAKVFRDGYAVSIEDAELNDVVYYNKDSETIYLYSDKISGTYNEAYPNKANVTSVEISGKVLELETQTAANKLGEKSGSFKIGSKITALMGRDGKIVDVVNSSSSDKANYGVLLSYTTEMSDNIYEDGQQYNYISVLNGEGNVMKYKTRTAHDDYIGYIGSLTFDNEGYASFKPISSPNVITGTVDKNNRKIGNHWLTEDCVIIERVLSPFSSMETGTSAHTLDIDDIVPTELTENHVVHAVTSGGFDDISVLFVENVSSESHQYGILKSASGSARGASVSGKYEIFSSGKLSTYSTGFYNNIPEGSAVAMTFDTNGLASIKKIVTVESRAKVSVADFIRIKIGSEVYKVSDNVQLIKKNGSNYESIGKSEIENITGKSVTLFADSNPDSGGLIRIVFIHE